MERNRYRWTATLVAVLIAAVGATHADAAVDCARFDDARVSHFTKTVEHAVARCLRRHPAAECLDAKAATRLDDIRARTAAKMERRCPSGDAATRLANAQSDAYCRLLAQCPPPPGAGGSITVRVSDGSAARSARAAGSRQLNMDLGWTGQVRNIQVFEGASYTAQLSNCDGTSDTQCDFHAAVAGTRFGAPAHMAGGGVTACMILDFISDVDGTIDLVSGDLTETMRVKTSFFVGLTFDQGCPTCLTADGDPQIGETGTCVGGPSHGAPCTVEGLSDPAYGAQRGTSNDCQPNPGALIAEQLNDLSSTSGHVTLATDADSPDCRAPGFRDLKCLCDTCNNRAQFPMGFGGVCGANADCPVSGGQPGICGGARCYNGPNDGEPCAVHSDCPGGNCYRPGMATAPNQCDDQICTPVAGGGECAGGPMEQRCTIQSIRGCVSDNDCPMGDTCANATNRSCIPDPLELVGTPDAPMSNVAHPTVVGTFCMGPTASAAVNAVTGLPGPATYTWPTEVTFSE